MRAPPDAKRRPGEGGGESNALVGVGGGHSIQPAPCPLACSPSCRYVCPVPLPDALADIVVDLVAVKT